MTADMLLSLCAFAVVSSITPGPSNLMLLSSGANFGFRRTLPQIFGIAAGFGALLAGVALGLGVLLTAAPALHVALKFGGAGYLLYLAWRIATARSAGAESRMARPLSFAEAAAFQWINPKAWVAAVSAMAVYASAEAPLRSVVWVVPVFTLAILPSLAIWAGCGMALRAVLGDARRLRLFNLALGVLLALSLWPMLH